MYNSSCDNMNGGFFRSTERATKYTHNDRVVFKAPVLGYPPHVVADCGPQVRELCVMAASDGRPCEKCGTSKWYKCGACVECKKHQRRRWYENNQEKVKESRERWARANPEANKAIILSWQRRHPDRSKSRDKRYKESHPEKVRARNHVRRGRETGNGGSYTPGEWRDLCNRYGNRCLRCGRTDVRLTVDHILPVSKGGSSNIENIQPLCKSCNSKKNDRCIDYRPDAGPMRWLQAKLFG